jgi:cell wall-associated NlpC family hydrolase
MYMDTHQKSEAITDIIVVQKSTVIIGTENRSSSQTMVSEDADKIVKKSELIDLKDTTIAAINEPDMVDNKDSTSVVISDRVAVVKEPKKVTVAEEMTKETSFEEPLDPVIIKYADKISVDPTDINNYPLYRFIDQWYGTRYRWGGEDNTGIDCSAFSQKLYGKVYGIDLTRTAKQQHRNCERIKDADNAEEGDLVFFRIHRLRVSHVGVYLANGYFVHASRSQGVVISDLNSKYWHRRYAGCGRVEKEDKAAYESDAVQ